MLTVVACPTVRPSVTSRYCSETTRRRLLFSTYPTLCYKKIWAHPKIRLLPSGTLFQTPDLENFAKARRSYRQQTRRRGRRRSSLLMTPVGLRQSTSRAWLFTASRSISCNPITALLRFVVDLLHNLFLRLTRFRLT